MQIWSYEAIDATGKTMKGTVEADTKDDVLKLLHDQGLTVTKISEAVGLQIKNLLSFSIGGIPDTDKLMFMKQFSTMTAAGLPITQTMESLVDQIKNQSFKSTMEKVLNDVKAGSSLSQAFSKHPSLFNNIQINLIKAGEESGNLMEMVQKITEDIERRRDLVGKVKGALIYPVIIFVVIIVVILLMMVVLVPAVSSIYEGFNAEMPAITQAMINISNFINPSKSLGGVFVLIFMIVGVIAYLSYRRSESGRYASDKFLLRVPIFGQITKETNLAEFCRILSMLLQSGVPILNSLKIVSGAMTNEVFTQAVLATIPEVEKGSPLAVPIAAQTAFPTVLSRIIATGEESGKLDKVLSDIGLFYASEVKQKTDNLTKIMEPVILIIVGVATAFVAVAVYLPIFNLASVIK